MSIANEISRLQTAKADIKSAIEAKGVSVPSSASISTYDDYVLQIQTGGGGSCTDTQVLTDLIERDLTSIVIPSATTSIGDYVFYDCYGLTSVTIPNGVTSIGSSAFRNCISLTSVTIPNSVTSIDNSAFTNCTGLTSVTIGSGVTSINNGVFYNCTSLSSITINATSVPTLGGTNVFMNTNDCPIYVPCSSVDAYKAANNWSTYASRIQCIQPSFDGKYKFTLTDDSVVSGECDASSAITNAEVSAYTNTLKEAVIGDCVTSIGEYAFNQCTSLTEVVLPDSVTSIGQAAFYFCSLSSCTIGSGVTSIGRATFYHCESLTNINIPNSVTNIGLEAFDGCSGLTSVTIPNSVTNIEPNAFQLCSSLPSVTIPDSVTSIRNNAFAYCSGLTSVTVNAATPPTLGTDVFTNTNNCPIYVPAASVEAYKTASGWSDYASRIQAIS